jgi:hypothetical protein
MTVTGTVAEWEAWSGLSLPEPGRHTVPGALTPISVDRSRDVGRYEEPNVGMLHDVESAATADASPS